MPDRTLPPPLEPVLPDCSVCGETVSTEDDSFYCEGCDAWWSMSDAFNVEGDWDDAEKLQCESTDEQGGSTYRCVLSGGHDRDHRPDPKTYGNSWPGKPYKVWGARSPAGFVQTQRNEREARYLVGIIPGDEVVWRMSDQRGWVKAEAIEVAVR